jgi:hypothetical protein
VAKAADVSIHVSLRVQIKYLVKVSVFSDKKVSVVVYKLFLYI